MYFLEVFLEVEDRKSYLCVKLAASLLTVVFFRLEEGYRGFVYTGRTHLSDWRPFSKIRKAMELVFVSGKL